MICHIKKSDVSSNDLTFKKCHIWTKEEEEVLRKYFYDLPASRHHGSRFEYLKDKLKLHGHDTTNITEKAISRKTYRLGLKSKVIVNELVMLGNCNVCGNCVARPQRYLDRALCEDCSKLSKNTPKDMDKHRAYQKKYQKEWRKNKKSPLI